MFILISGVSTRKVSTTGKQVNSSAKSGSTNGTAAMLHADQSDPPSAATAAHQPDLVKVSSPNHKGAAEAQQKLKKLEISLAEKSKETERLKAAATNNATGFEAMVVTVNYLANQVLQLHFLYAYKI